MGWRGREWVCVWAGESEFAGARGKGERGGFNDSGRRASYGWAGSSCVCRVDVVHDRTDMVRASRTLPAFRTSREGEFRDYQAAHARLTTRVVIVPMILELSTSAMLVVRPPVGLSPLLAWAGLLAAII